MIIDGELMVNGLLIDGSVMFAIDSQLMFNEGL